MHNQTIRVEPYQPSKKHVWDMFVEKYGIWQFQRDFMDYHADRFADASIFLWKKHTLIGLVPFNWKGSAWVSHAGLSYGGLVSIPMSTQEQYAVWKAILAYGLEQGWERLIYKPFPPYLKQQWHDRDSLLLHWLEAKVVRVENSALVQGYHPERWKPRRRQLAKKAAKIGALLQENTAWEQYWELLKEMLWQRHQATPVHSFQEICCLRELFPQKMKLVTVWMPIGLDAGLEEGHRRLQLVGGTLLWEYDKVTHAQYTASNDMGRQYGALDYLFAQILKQQPIDRIFSFGTSSLKSTGQLNTSLQSWKDSWGTQSWPHYIYELPLKNISKLDQVFG